MSPTGAGRHGAFREAKRTLGIRVSEQPTMVRGIYDNQTGKELRVYSFNDPNSTGKIAIVDHADGHVYPNAPLQNRGSHFNLYQLTEENGKSVLRKLLGGPSNYHFDY